MIKSINWVEFRKDKNGRKYSRTHAILIDELGNLEEAVGFGKHFRSGMRVEFFHHFGQNKMRRSHRLDT